MGTKYTYKSRFAAWALALCLPALSVAAEGDIIYFDQIANLDSIPSEMIAEQVRIQSQKLFQSKTIDEQLHASLRAVCRTELATPSAEIGKALIPLVSEEYGRSLQSACASKGGCFVANWSADFSLFQDCSKAAQRHLADSSISEEDRKIWKRALLKALVPGSAYDFNKNARREIASSVHTIVHETYPEIPFREDARKVKGDLAQLIDLTAESGFVDKLETRLMAASRVLQKLGLSK